MKDMGILFFVYCEYKVKMGLELAAKIKIQITLPHTNKEINQNITRVKIQFFFF